MKRFNNGRMAVFAFLGALVVALVSNHRALANSFYLNLVVDPPTTAFNGIPAPGGFNGASTRFGHGTWHLYALDDVRTSYGLATYAVQLNPGPGGTIPAINNRSPVSAAMEFDEFYAAGFGFLRTSNNQNPIIGSQDITFSTPRIGGFGQTPSNFDAKLPNATFFATTNGQWGNYATAQPHNFGSGFRHPLFLAEGTYTGAPPTVNFADSSAYVYTSADLATFESVPQILPQPVCLCGISVSLGSIKNVNAYDPGVVNYTFTAFADLPQPGPLTWGPLNFVQWAGPGGGGIQIPSSVAPATIDPITHKVTWNTFGAPLGLYLWSIEVSAQGYSGIGTLYVEITRVPEPGSAGLLLFGLIAAAGRRRR